jgi:hypothetical protein
LVGEGKVLKIRRKVRKRLGNLGVNELTSSFSSLSSSLFSRIDHLDLKELGDVPLRLSFGDCDNFDASLTRLLKLLLFGDEFSSFWDFESFSSSVLFSASLFVFRRSQLKGGVSGRL